MRDDRSEQSIFRLFAELLDYPKPGLGAWARQAGALLGGGNSDAMRILEDFACITDRTPLGQLEEVYTGLFELNALCHPYVGYHLFGETYKRSVFMLGLKERYSAQGFSVDPELPDHLTALLRYISVCNDPVMIDELVRDALLPALDKMIASESNDQPMSGMTAAYHRLLQALQTVLQMHLSESADIPTVVAA
ncbi:MAG: nitrate reductase molybdenum cofactor assembly chaperone [Acidobacteriota bacterium]